ncbi:prenyl protease 1 [Vairimorpha apis BRL 01]|uniref:Prenyl protease 1 n=1 Tax=Vairimorpha apis BRL 01 TaxID=1037528 RepID=T0MJ33_9MICR|nr:prenyl protease 1 [Vairimorpha apis BRL 01]
MRNFINNYHLLIATYLLFYLDDEIYYEDNEILYLPFLFYTFMLFMYNKMKYLYGVLRIAFYIGYFFIYMDISKHNNNIERYMKSYNKKAAENIKKYILKKFIDEVKNNNYKLYIKEYKFRPANVEVFFRKESIFVEVCGDVLKKLTKNEFTSILYHELKHVLIGTLKVRIIDLINFIFMLAAEYLIIYLSRKKINSKDSPKNCLKIYLFINVTLGVFFNYLRNYIIYLEEIECDRYSVLHHDKSYLISAYTKLYNLDNNFVKQSYLYNIMYQDHPSLDRRINYINSM